MTDDKHVIDDKHLVFDVLVFGGLLLLGGWCADRFGALRVLRWALLGFALTGGAVTVVSAVGPVIEIGRAHV